jgi:predicted cupin superfamily sugar epimerase
LARRVAGMGCKGGVKVMVLKGLKWLKKGLVSNEVKKVKEVIGPGYYFNLFNFFKLFYPINQYPF